jgi:hypothetical protein
MRLDAPIVCLITDRRRLGADGGALRQFDGGSRICSQCSRRGPSDSGVEGGLETARLWISSTRLSRSLVAPRPAPVNDRLMSRFAAPLASISERLFAPGLSRHGSRPVSHRSVGPSCR